MIIREAEIRDIVQMQKVRHAVKENILSDPSLVPYEAYVTFITERGKGWVCEVDDKILGFAFADLVEENIWALFILPEEEGKGIGKRLQMEMLDWYFDSGKDYVWLGTSPGTRAEKFYTNTGWVANGTYGDEIKFEMTRSQWLEIKKSNIT